MAIKISEYLRSTVESHPHIQEVHFTKTGEHFFTRHELKEKGKSTGKFYGRLGVKPVVAKVEGDRKIYKNESVAMPEFEIVKTLSREEILKEKKEAAPVDNKHLTALKEENEKLKAELAKVKGNQK